MTTYNYFNALCADILDYIGENINLANYLTEDGLDADELAKRLNNDCWTADSVTGNASGSYYCNAHKAREALRGNEDVLIEAIEEFGDCPEDYKRALTSPEWADVTIRCYMLGQAVGAVVGALADAVATADTALADIDLTEIFNEIEKGA